MHNGESVVVDRKTGSQIIHVPSALVSITGGIQPRVLNRVVGSTHGESGLLARVLLAMPPSGRKGRTDAAIMTNDQAPIDFVFDRLYQLEPDRNGSGEPVPRTVQLAGDGKRVWVEFYNAHAEEHGQGRARGLKAYGQDQGAGPPEG